jgi:SET domain-containing protein
MKYPIRKSVSNISGFGLFATEDILPGQTICFMEGRKIIFSNGKEVNPLKGKEWENDETIREGDLFQIKDNEYIILEEVYRCINHSCNPNTFIRGKNELVALKPIKKNEELTYDYSATMWELEDKWEMNCNCKSKNCRKVIKQFYELPPEHQKRYIEQGAVQDHILAKSSVLSLR